MSNPVKRLTDAFYRAFAPPADLTGTQWADTYFYLSPESAATPGKWTTFPYQQGILDAITDPAIEEIWLRKSARMGYTKILDITIGYYLHQDPCPILYVQPTVEDAQGTSKEEIDPMLRDVPVLANLVSERTRRGAREKDNTILNKTIKGPNGRALLSLVGANSPRGFRRVSRRLICLDEVDAYPLSAGVEGDQVALAKKRSEFYTNRKIIGGSTPTVKHLSRIDKEMEDTDNRQRYLPCPKCGHMQYLQWGGKDTDYGLKWQNKDPETARYLCEKCHEYIDHSWLYWMDQRGQWLPTKQGNPKKAGFNIWAAYSYSPNSTWAHIVAEWLEARGNPEKEIVFINTVRGQSYEAEGEQTNPKDLATRLQSGWKPYEIPAGIALLIQTVDVQEKWLECQTIGIGPGERAWLIDHEAITGSPKDPETWSTLEAWRTAPRTSKVTGLQIKAEICLIDSNYETASVVNYVRPRYKEKVFACRGEEKLATKTLVAKGQTRKERTLQYRIATWDFKAILQHRLAIGDDRPHRIYLPDWVSDSYLNQITSERLIRRRDRKTGRVTLSWIKTQERNEILDLWVYALAALRILQEYHGRKKYTDLEKLYTERIAENIIQKATEILPLPEPPPLIKPRLILPAHRR